MNNAKKVLLATTISLLSLSASAQETSGDYSVPLPNMGDPESNAAVDYYANELTNIGATRAGDYIDGQTDELGDRARNQVSRLADRYIEGSGNSDSVDSAEDIVIPPVLSQVSLCLSETAKEAQEFIDNLTQRTCDNIDQTPSAENSRYKYTSQDVGCNFQLPGLPPMGSSGEEPGRCQGVSAITGDMIDRGVGQLNQSWNQGVNGINGRIQEDTGIDSSEWTSGYENAPNNGRDAIQDWSQN